MLVVESNLESGAIENKVHYTGDMGFILDEWEDVFAFSSINLLALATTEVVEVGIFCFLVAVLALSIFLSLGFGFSQGLEVLGHVLFHSWCLEGDKSLLEQVD